MFLEKLLKFQSFCPVYLVEAMPKVKLENREGIWLSPRKKAMKMQMLNIIWRIYELFWKSKFEESWLLNCFLLVPTWQPKFVAKRLGIVNLASLIFSLALVFKSLM